LTTDKSTDQTSALSAPTYIISVMHVSIIRVFVPTDDDEGRLGRLKVRQCSSHEVAAIVLCIIFSYTWSGCYTLSGDMNSIEDQGHTIISLFLCSFFMFIKKAVLHKIWFLQMYVCIITKVTSTSWQRNKVLLLEFLPKYSAYCYVLECLCYHISHFCNSITITPPSSNIYRI
jgi:hypothetical protein